MRQTICLLFAGTSLLAFAPQAQAAEAQAAEAAPSVVVVDDIIVTARRRDEALQDVPGSINVVTADAIGELNLRSFTEVQTLVPGLDLALSADGIAGSAKLRGVNFDTRASGNNATVEFYFNDAPISAGIILQQMYDVGQIEVQRGPQGTLRGRASPSGAITIVSRKPDLFSWGGFVDFTANDIGATNLRGGVNVPLIEGIAAIRVAGVYDYNELDRVRPISGISGRETHQETWSGRVSALVTPTDWLRLEGTYQRLDRKALTYDQAISFSEVNPAAAASPVLIRARDRRSIQEDGRPIDMSYDIYNWRAELALAGQRLIYQGQHTVQDMNSQENFDAGNFFVGRDVNQVTRTVATGTSHEIRLQNDERVAGMFDYVAGFFDSRLDAPTSLTRPTVVRLPVAFGGGIAQIVQTAIGRTNETHEQSFFGHLTAHVGPRTEISGGLRHISYEAAGSLVVDGRLITADSQDESQLIYTASVRHEFADDLSVYAATGSSFRPGINVVGNFNIAPSAQELAFMNLPAETSESYEIGLKSALFDRRLMLNLSAFHQRFTNFPYRTPDTGVFYVNTVALGGNVTAQQVAAFNFVGAVPVEVNGAEAEIAFRASDRWDIGLVASYALGKIKDGLIPCNDLNGDGVPDVVGAAPSLAVLQAAVGADNVAGCSVSQRSAFIPPFSATLTSEYRMPVSGTVDGYVRGLYSFRGKSQGDPTNNFDQVGAFGLLNLFAGVRDPEGKWEISLFAKNLLSTTRVLSRTSPLFTSYQQLPGAIINGVPTITGRPTATTFTSTYTGATITPPREFGLNLRFALGSR